MGTVQTISASLRSHPARGLRVHLRMLRVLAHLLALLVAGGLAAPAAADIVVGVAGPTQGTGARAARQILAGVNLAADRFNAQGGVVGETLTVVEADDGCAPGEAEAAARDLIAKGARVVIGHPCAGAASAAAKIYAQAGTLFLAPATRHPALTNPRTGPTVFRLSGRDDLQGDAAGAYLAQAFAGKPIAVIKDASLYAKKLSAGALAALKAAGRTDIMTATIAGAQKDFTSLVGKLAGANTEAVLFAGFPLEGSLLLRQMRARGLKTLFLGGDALAAPQFPEAAAEDTYGAGVLLPADPSRTLAEATRTGFPGRNPTGPFLSAYAAMEIWREGVRAVRSLDGSTVAGALQQRSFDSVLGRITFDENGNADLPSYDIVWWKDGAWRPKKK